MANILIFLLLWLVKEFLSCHQGVSCIQSYYTLALKLAPTFTVSAFTLIADATQDLLKVDSF